MSKQEEEYRAYLAEQQEEKIQQLTTYWGLKDWLDSLNISSHPHNLIRILDLCAQLVTADIRDNEDIIGQIEEELR